MSAWNKYLLLIATFLWCGATAFAQPINDLKLQKKKLEEEISFAKQKLSELEQKRTLTLTELVTLKKQIQSREALIHNISRQIASYDNQINQGRGVIHSLERDIEQLRKEYARMIVYTYTNRNSYDNLLFVFSAKSFNDAYQRVKYLKEYSDFREQQAELIEKTLKTLEDEIAALEEKRREKEALKKAEEEQRNTLAKEQRQMGNKISDFKSKEEEYMTKLRKSEQEAAKLDKQIEKLIAEAARKNAAKTTTGSNLPALTPEALALSNSFESNKGKLPWPVERGTIVRGFGKKEHAVLKGIYTDNNGIDISTLEEAEVRAIYEGTVATTFYQPTYHRCVIINHGEYFSVYLNMKEVYVKEGDRVKTKQTIGKVFTDSNEGKSEVHLQIWKSNVKLNPALWIFQ